MRISGTLGGAFISLLVAWGLPALAGPDADGSGLLFWVGLVILAYLTFSATVPWLLEGPEVLEATPLGIGLIGVIIGAPFWFSMKWLAASPFSTLAWFPRVALGFWVLLFLASIVYWLITRGRSTEAED